MASSRQLTFQLYRINLQGKTLPDLQGARLAELELPSSFVTGIDRVSAVTQKLRPELADHLRPTDNITLWFAGRPMRDDGLFYADHYMLLPVWVQVLLHDCDRDELLAKIAELRPEKPS